MIVRIMSRGKSFKGLGAYLTHDPEAQTQERVAWTHTHNLANDDIPSAINEMYLTSENAELLKQESGVRAGGRSVENTVKHLSLNWAPDQTPTREQMISASESFLRGLGWGEHQAIVVAHQDKHPHVHLMINVCHPETGLALDDGFERRRAQAWALEYERENGKILCEQRLLNAAEREKSPPRNIWTAFQESEKEFSRVEKLMAENTGINPKNEKSAENIEWENLKTIQRDERRGFFASGRIEFKELRNSVFREIHEEYRERWAEYYSGKENGAHPADLARLKAEIVSEQKIELGTRRDAACQELRQSRDTRYRELLEDQRLMREGLRTRQKAGFDNTLFLQMAEDGSSRYYLRNTFNETALETTRNRDSYETTNRNVVPEGEGGGRAVSARASEDIGVDIGISPASLFEAFFTELTNLGSAKPEPARRTPDLAATAAAEITSKQQQRERELADDGWNERQRSR